MQRATKCLERLEVEGDAITTRLLRDTLELIAPRRAVASLLTISKLFFFVVLMQFLNFPMQIKNNDHAGSRLGLS